jgi:hypothetical protein
MSRTWTPPSNLSKSLAVLDTLEKHVHNVDMSFREQFDQLDIEIKVFSADPFLSQDSDFH